MAFSPPPKTSRKAYSRSTTQGNVLTGRFWVTYVEWKPVAANDEFQMQDSAGEILGEDTADSVSRKIFPIFGWVEDLTLTTMTGSAIVRFGSYPHLAERR